MVRKLEQLKIIIDNQDKQQRSVGSRHAIVLNVNDLESRAGLWSAGAYVPEGVGFISLVVVVCLQASEMFS